MSQQKHQVCLLLGSNIEPERNLPRVIELLRREVTILRSSSVWQTAAVGENGPDFLNMALLIATPLAAAELKEAILRPLEARLGRMRTQDKYAPRTIDLDIILFDGQVVDADLFLYAHRAVPVSEIQPDIRSTKGDRLEEVAQNLLETSQIRLKPDVFIET